MDGSHPFPTAYAVGYTSNARFAGYYAVPHEDWNGYAATVVLTVACAESI